MIFWAIPSNHSSGRYHGYEGGQTPALCGGTLEPLGHGSHGLTGQSVHDLPPGHMTCKRCHAAALEAVAMLREHKARVGFHDSLHVAFPGAWTPADMAQMIRDHETLIYAARVSRFLELHALEP